MIFGSKAGSFQPGNPDVWGLEYISAGAESGQWQEELANSRTRIRTYINYPAEKKKAEEHARLSLFVNKQIQLPALVFEDEISEPYSLKTRGWEP